MSAVYVYKLLVILQLLQLSVVFSFRLHHVQRHWQRESRLHNSDVAPDFFEPTREMLENSAKEVSDVTEADYVVIGSGIGGLSAAALLAWYGKSVIVCESHYLPGGVAHSFERNGFKFDAGPSLWNGMSTKPYNPLREILEIVGQGDSVEYAQYDGWMMYVPEGSFKFTVGANKFEPVLQKFGGANVLNEWFALNQRLKPIQQLATAIPPLALRNDPFLALTLLPHLPAALILGAPVANKVQGPFKDITKDIVKDKFLENWLEFLSFALSGLPADGTIAAAVAYTMRDLHQERAALDYPIGGSGAVIDALIRAITHPTTTTTRTTATSSNNNNKILLNTHIERILVENNRATGVVLRKNGKIIRAKKAVISNASIWDTMKLIPKESITTEYRKTKESTPMTNSFVHLHLGIDATGLENLETHYSVINNWHPIDAPQNHVIISIPSVLDKSLAPENGHVIHAYAAANEPYALYDRNTANMTKQEYEAFKTQRCEFLFQAIERFIPDVRQRIKVQLLGSPLTHERFNRRFQGTYGPALRAGVETFPYPKTELEGLLQCGDSIFPGIGVPAVAASGANAASSTVSVMEHWKLLAELDKIRATY